jgi:type IV pilus assembly protein PilW
VELMVGLTIGLFLMGAVGLIYVNTSTSSRSSTLESQMNEDATLALEILQQQIRLAGFSRVNADGNRLFNGLAVRGCDLGFTDNAADTGFDSLVCNDSGNGSDALAIRYEATLLNSYNVKDATGVDRPGNCANESIADLTAGAEGASSGIALADNRYYIAEDTDGTPSLYCKGRTGDGFGTAVALIPHIEDLQVKYAVTAAPRADEPLPHQVVGYVDAEDIPPAAAGGTDGDWSRVAAVRICLLARTSRPVPLGDNAFGAAATEETEDAEATAMVTGLGTYRDCDGVEQTGSDRFLRRTYVTTIQLRNMRPGLPADFDPAATTNNPWAYLYED